MRRPAVSDASGLSGVCLVSMPFAAVERPSIALGLLQAILRRGGIGTTTVFPNLTFAASIGLPAYGFWERAVGDLAFASAAFPDLEPAGDAACITYLRRRYGLWAGDARRSGVCETEHEFLELFATLRRDADEFVERAARDVIATGARIVGCTSMYWQHTASLALLRRIRAIDPHVVTLLGGANCEGVMGLATHRNFPWVDFVISGEADDLIVSLCRDVLAHGRDVPRDRLAPGIFGPVHRDSGSNTGGDTSRDTGYPSEANGDGAVRAACRDVRCLPLPDYDDYFRALAASPLRAAIKPGLLLETARGCWWGAVHQCTFCGISEGGMRYQSRTPDQVVGDFTALEERHGIRSFEVTDNILDLSYFKHVLPRLAEDGHRRNIFWETKANLKNAQVEALARAGVRWIQPGIESLDSHVLGLINKGVQASQNLQLLRWSRELGVRVVWNLLWGFPREEDAWYAEMARLLPRFEHLQPPRLVIRLRYDRYSVYQARAAEYGLRLRPSPFMALSYPLPERELQDLTYYFVPDEDQIARVRLSGRPGVVALHRAVSHWQQRFWRGLSPIVASDDDGTCTTVIDTRSIAVETRARLTGLARDVLRACDEPVKRSALAGVIAGMASGGASEGRSEHAIDAALAELDRRRLIVRLDDRIVSLVLRGQVPALPAGADFPGGHVRWTSPRASAGATATAATTYQAEAATK